MLDARPQLQTHRRQRVLGGLAATALLLAGGLLGIACSGDTAPTPPPSTHDWSEGPARLVVDTPTHTDAFATLADQITLTGTSWGKVDRVELRVNGASPVKLASGGGEWSVDIPLAVGRTTLEVTAHGPAAPRTKTITALRTEFADFRSAVRVTPQEIVARSRTDVVVSAAIDGAPEAVTLVRLDLVPWGEGERIQTPIGELRDDGAGADLIADDGLFTGAVTIEEPSADVLLLLAVEVTMPGHPPESSPEVQVQVVEPWTPEEMLDAEGVSNLGYQVFRASFDGSEGTRDAAIEAAALALEADPRVLGVARGQHMLSVELASGDSIGLMFRPDDMMGGGSPIDCVHALRLAPFEWRFSSFYPHTAPETLQNGLNQCTTPYELRNKVTQETNGTVNIGVGVPDFEAIDGLDLLLLDSHGLEYTDPSGTDPTVDTIVVPVKWCGAHDPINGTPPSCFPLSPEELKILNSLTRTTPPKAYGYVLEEPGKMVQPGQPSEPMQRYIGLLLTPEFFRRLPLKEQTIVFASACESFMNGTLAEAFLNNGAGAYFGYDKSVKISFAARQSNVWTKCMTLRGSTPGDCYTGEHLDTETDTMGIGAKLLMMERNGGAGRILCN